MSATLGAKAGKVSKADGCPAGEQALVADNEDTLLDQSSYEALARFRMQVRRFFAYSEAVLKDGNLPTAQYQALLAIRAWAGPDPITTSELAAELFVKLNSAVELIDRMEVAGLVRRERNPADRRRMSLSLSDTGSTTLETFARLHLEAHRRLLPELSRTVCNLRDAIASA